MAFIKDHAVPALVGAVISIFMDQIVVHYIKVALRSERMRESLENMDNTSKAVLTIFLDIREKCNPSVLHLVDEWDRRSKELGGRASAMVEEHTRFSRLHHKLNMFSRHRRSKDIANLISEMDKHLKLLFVVLLECVLSLILNKRRLPGVFLFGGRTHDYGFHSCIFGDGCLGWIVTTVILGIISFIKRLLNFKKKLTSLTDLMNEIHPFVGDCQRMLEQIDANQSENWLNDARDWVRVMGAIIEEGREIRNMWSPIARYNVSGQITGLTSRIDAHLNKLLWITLALLFHENEGSTGHTLSTLSQETLTSRRDSSSSQETESWETVSYEADGSTSHPTAPQPQETEGSTASQETESSETASYEADGSTSHPTAPQPQETEGSRSHPTAPQETEGSRSHPTPPLQDVSITVT